MNDLWPVFQAIGATIGALVGGVTIVQRTAKRGASTNGMRIEVLRDLRERLEVAEAKVLILTGERDESRSALGSTRHDLDDCARQRDDAYAELRNVHRRKQS